MTGTERRNETRVAVDMFLNQYIRDEPHRSHAVNVSETGLYVQRLVEPVSHHSRVVALEFELPGTGEVIWAKAESRFEAIDEDFHRTGIHFLSMARKHERLLRDFVYDRDNRDRNALLYRFRRNLLLRPLQH